MKKLIRRKVGHDFAMEDGGWTPDITNAQQFPGVLAITSDVRAQFAPYDIELYYAFDDHGPSEFDFCQGQLVEN